MKITITYHVASEESAEHGDLEDHGFYVDGNHYSMNEENICQDVEDNPKDYEFTGGLLDAIAKGKELGCSKPSCSPINPRSRDISFSDPDGDINLQSGDRTYHTIYFSGVGERTIRRLAKEFKCRVSN